MSPIRWLPLHSSLADQIYSLCSIQDMGNPRYRTSHHDIACTHDPQLRQRLLLLPPLQSLVRQGAQPRSRAAVGLRYAICILPARRANIRRAPRHPAHIHQGTYLLFPRCGANDCIRTLCWHPPSSPTGSSSAPPSPAPARRSYSSRESRSTWTRRRRISRLAIFMIRLRESKSLHPRLSTFHFSLFTLHSSLFPPHYSLFSPLSPHFSRKCDIRRCVHMRRWKDQGWHNCDVIATRASTLLQDRLWEGSLRFWRWIVRRAHLRCEVRVCTKLEMIPAGREGIETMFLQE